MARRKLAKAAKPKKYFISHVASVGSDKGTRELFPSLPYIISGGKVTANGIGGLGGNPRYVLAPEVNLLKKEVTSTAPVRHLITYDITFYVAADSFRTQVSREKPEVRIAEAKRCIPAAAV